MRHQLLKSEDINNKNSLQIFDFQRLLNLNRLIFQFAYSAYYYHFKEGNKL